MGTTGRALTSTLGEDGKLTIALAEQILPDPVGPQVLIRVEAAPINPSDLGMLFGAADLANAEFASGRIVAPVPERGMRAMAGRLGLPLPVGNEGAGTVIAAGEAPEAQHLLGKRVTAIAGGMYADYRLADARACMALPDSISAESGAAAFVNPLTALGFVETMRREGFTGIVHTAAASNLGQMLVRLCAEENVPLVNIVRKPEQAEILRALGAEHVLNSSEDGFDEALTGAIAATGAMLAFDAIGGGKLADRILGAMERAAVAAKGPGAPYSVYGTDTPKKVYIYGLLDPSPTVLDRGYGFSWTTAGWLLTPFLGQIGPAGMARLRARVLDGLDGIFASTYKARIPLAAMLDPETARAYAALKTGEKYLVVPAG